MKLFAKFLIAALFIAMLLPFTILKGPDGGTLMSLSDIGLPDFSMPDLPSVPSGSKMSSALDGGGQDIFYQWYDADGNVQFTTEPPPQGIEYTVKGYDPATNVIRAVELPSEESQPDEASGQAEKIDKIGNPYDPERIEKLFEDAKNVEKLLKQRFEDADAALNQ